MDSLHLSSTYRFLRRSALSLFTPMLLGGMAIAPGLLMPEAVRAQSADTFNTQQYLRQGSRSINVLRMQRMLLQLGYLDDADIDIPVGAQEGFFGPATRIAVERFQRDSKLAVDGVAGPKTLSRLFGLSNPDRSNIAFMQAQLKALGYYQGGIDGQLGDATNEALRDMQNETFFIRTSLRSLNAEQLARAVNDYYARVRIPRGLPSNQAIEDQVVGNLGESVSVGPYGRAPNPIASDQGWPRPETTSSPYEVMVPYRGDYQMLRRIRTVATNASVRSHPLGDYVHAGSFSSRGEAEALKKLLVEEGLVGARVIFVQ